MPQATGLILYLKIHESWIPGLLILLRHDTVPSMQQLCVTIILFGNVFTSLKREQELVKVRQAEFIQELDQLSV